MCLRTAVLILLLGLPPGLLADPTSQPASRPHEPVRLVFSIDQGFGNGVVVSKDLDAVRRMARAMRTLEPAYRVYAVLNPQLADREAFRAVLDVLKAEDVPFVLDVYSSDGETLGTSVAHNRPADGVHGITISIENLAELQRVYGRYLAGLRFMEVFAMDFTDRAVKTTNPEWNTTNWKVPDDDFFQPKFARPFLDFARKHGLFIQWSDWHWFRFAAWDAPLKEDEQQLKSLLKEYPGLVIVTYANNQPKEESVPLLKSWHEAVQPFVAAGAVSFGLSDQAWLREPEMNCPPQDIVAWAERALELGCTYIQFEPAWYFFKLPRGTFGVPASRDEAVWPDGGTPTDAFKQLRRSLMAVPASRSRR